MSSGDEIIQVEGFMLRRVQETYNLCIAQYDALNEFEQSFITNMGDVLELAEQFGFTVEMTRRQWNFFHQLHEKYKSESEPLQ